MTSFYVREDVIYNMVIYVTLYMMTSPSQLKDTHNAF